VSVTGISVLGCPHCACLGGTQQTRLANSTTATKLPNNYLTNYQHIYELRHAIANAGQHARQTFSRRLVV
jgi:hypothetical protein